MEAKGTRAERAVHRAFGSKRGGSHWQRAKTDGANLPSFLSAKSLSPFINNELAMALTSAVSGLVLLIHKADIVIASLLFRPRRAVLFMQPVRSVCCG